MKEGEDEEFERRREAAGARLGGRRLEEAKENELEVEC